MSTRTTSSAHALPGGRVPDAIAADLAPSEELVRFLRAAKLAAEPRTPSGHYLALAVYANELADLFFDRTIRK